MALIYKILPAGLWQAALERGRFDGAAIDLSDGYIHFSAEHQVEETARRHFAGIADLVLVGLDSTALGEALRWEPSRGGDLFPHLYGPLDTSHARWVKPLTWNGEAHVFPEGWRA